MANPINVLVFTLHSDFITGKHLVASKSSLYMLPQYTVALQVSKNYSKMANLKWSEFSVHLLPLFFFLQLA